MPKRQIELLEPNEVANLIATFKDNATGKRNAAIVAVLYRCGLRISEALDLKERDVSLRRGSIRVQNGKGNKARTAAMDRMAADYLREWMFIREELEIDRRAPLFCSVVTGAGGKNRVRPCEIGGPMSDRYVRKFLKRAADKAGIIKRVHPHGFRHTHAVELIEEGVPLNIVQRQLGHSSAVITDNYIKHISGGHVIETISNRKPQECFVRQEADPVESQDMNVSPVIEQEVYSTWF